MHDLPLPHTRQGHIGPQLALAYGFVVCCRILLNFVETFLGIISTICIAFALVMQDEELCAEFIERIFPGKKVKSLTFPNNIQITPEKTIVTGLLSRSV